MGWKPFSEIWVWRDGPLWDQVVSGGRIQLRGRPTVGVALLATVDVPAAVDHGVARPARSRLP